MSSVQHLREFISARLTAAAEEIFTEFERTIIQYEEEMGRQRRLLDLTWRPHIHLEPVDLPQHYTHKEEVALTDNQDRSSTVDHEEAEPPQIKEEPQENWSSPEEEQLVLKEETESFLTAVTQDNRDHRKPEPSRDQLLFQNPPLDVSPGCEGSNREASESAADAERKAPRSRRAADGGRSHHVGQSGTSERLRETGRTKKPVSCDVCGKAFPYRSHMITHRIVHTGERPFPCKICGKRFRRRHNLKEHIRIHTGLKPYCCQICGESFSHRSSLAYHTIVHAGQEIFTCETCGKGFLLRNNLTVHMRTHTGETL